MELITNIGLYAQFIFGVMYMYSFHIKDVLTLVQFFSDHIKHVPIYLPSGSYKPNLQHFSALNVG